MDFVTWLKFSDLFEVTALCTTVQPLACAAGRAAVVAVITSTAGLRSVHRIHYIHSCLLWELDPSCITDTVIQSAG